VRLSCNTVIFGRSDLDTALQHIAWAGYDGVEVAAIPRMAEHLDVHGNADHVAAVRDAAERHQLRLVAIEATGNLLEPAGREHLELALDRAHDLEIRVVNIGSGGKAGDESTWSPVMERIATLARRAGALGVKLGVKAHVGAAVWDGATLLRMLDEIDEPALGVNFDPSHIFRASPTSRPEDVARQLRGHVVACHVRDNLSRDPAVSPPRNQVPGNGSIDLKGLLDGLNDAGFRGYLSFECIGAKDYPLSYQAALAAEARGYLVALLRERLLWEPVPEGWP